MKSLLLAATTAAAVALAGLSFAQSSPPQETAQPQSQESSSPAEDDFESEQEGQTATAEDPATDPGDEAFASSDVDLGEPKALRDLRRLRPINGNAGATAASAAGCADCHGDKGIAPIPAMPHLAGLDATYLYEQVRLYHDRYLPDTSMTPLADELTDEDMRNISMYYASLPRKGLAARTTSEDAEEDALPPPTPEMLAAGERIYKDGDSTRGLPACVGCHGDNGLGHPLREQRNRSGHVPYAIYPALRGQDRQSLINLLNHYKSGHKHNFTSFHIMAPIAEKLDESSIDAVAAWLASLEG